MDDQNATSEQKVKPPKKKKSIFKRWWFWLLAIIVIIIIAVSSGGNKGSKGTDKSSASPSAPAVAAEMELSNGNFTSGIDFPAGTYDIEAIAGGGNVISTNMYSGGLNAMMGTADKNKANSTEMYKQQYSNISLPDGVMLKISNVTVKITSKAADGSPLKKREQPNTQTVKLGNGNFVSGTDFPAGTYDIVAVSGSGNVSSDNMYDGGINAIMATAEEKAKHDFDMYQLEYKNIVLPTGATLKIDGVEINLVPSK